VVKVEIKKSLIIEYKFFQLLGFKAPCCARVALMACACSCQPTPTAKQLWLWGDHKINNPEPQLWERKSIVCVTHAVYVLEHGALMKTIQKCRDRNELTIILP
jgi:hypothetical protein